MQAIRFYNCHNLTLSNLTHVDSPRNHISINHCKDASISNLTIIAPADSPNTDGIDIGLSTNVLINNSTMMTGDDCIAINNGSSFINITDVFCGPGHGISVGSLGKDKTYATVEHVHVKNCTFNGTTNGARIKTFKGGSGYARNITYEDIIVVGVKHPMIIDQYYDPRGNIGQAVEVSYVTYLNIHGTSLDKTAIELKCDTIIGCTNIVVDNVNITRVDGGEAQTICTKAQGKCSSCYPDVPCLSHNNSAIWY
ncbi:polygalacturonase [Trifolium pratense]|uniref:Polygalacturonase n=1 Tax=Trifolium pratense TaxID=57577 RepID=A0A2K3NHR4_TRIPR|nr:polygalacturonase [Trifolium pratense]